MAAAAGYTDLVIRYFERPCNQGHFEPASDVVDATAGHPGQGAVFHLSARIEQGCLAAVRFEAWGCPHCIAAGAWLTEQLTGRDVSSLDEWSWREAARALDVPVEKHGRLLLLEDTVRRLAEAARRHELT